MMNIIFLSLMTFLSAEDGVVKGEYIISNEKVLTKETVEFSLKKIPPASIESLGPNQYLLKYTQDPGLETLVRQSKHNFKVQPNFIYKAPKKRIKFKKKPD